MAYQPDVKVQNKTGTVLDVSALIPTPTIQEYFSDTFPVGDSSDNVIKANVNGLLKVKSLRVEGTGTDKYTFHLKKNSGTLVLRVRTSGDGTVDIDSYLGTFSATDDFLLSADRTQGSGGTTIYMIINYTIE